MKEKFFYDSEIFAMIAKFRYIAKFPVHSKITCIVFL